MPDLGLGATPIHASVWLVAKGQEVMAGDPLLEVLAADAVVDLASPCSGRLIEKCVGEDDVVQAGMVLGVLAREE